MGPWIASGGGAAVDAVAVATEALGSGLGDRSFRVQPGKALHEVRPRLGWLVGRVGDYPSDYATAAPHLQDLACLDRIQVTTEVAL